MMFECWPTGMLDSRLNVCLPTGMGLQAGMTPPATPDEPWRPRELLGEDAYIDPYVVRAQDEPDGEEEEEEEDDDDDDDDAGKVD